MSTDTHFFLALAAMALAAYVCRVAGYLLMGYVRITPRVEGALKAMPLGVMIGLVTPAIAAGKLPEMLALVVVVVVMKITGKDIAAALSGAATVAVARWVLAA